MEIKKYGMEELKQARQLQEDAVKLHLPSPPVLSWKVKVFDRDGHQISDIESKANSYVRNALNILAWQLGMCNYTITSKTVFGDSFVSLKSTEGLLYSVNANNHYRQVNSRSEVLIGTDNSAENLNSYVINLPTETIATDTQVMSTFANRKIITLISRLFSCNIETNYCEAGINLPYYLSSQLKYLLMVRDVFEPITVPANGSIIFTYQTEVLYPE